MANWSKLEVNRVEHHEPEAIVYRLAGVLTSSRESYDFLEDVQKSVHHAHKNAPPTNIIITLQDLDRITSAGVGVIAACFTSVTNSGGKLVLAAIPNSAQMVLNVVRLLTVIDHAPTEEEALAHLA